MERSESPNIKKAKHLINDLTVIKDQVQDLVHERDKWPVTKDGGKGTELQESRRTDASISSQPGPYPLDSYLKMPTNDPGSPYKTVPDLSSSQINAPILPGFKDAEAILQEVQRNRGYLEANLDAVLHARGEVEVYSMLEAMHNDSTNKERARIQKMVDSRIAKLRREVEREVTDDLVIQELNKNKATGVPGAVKVPAPAPSKPAPRYGLRAGLRTGLAEPKVEVKKPAVKRVGGKENIQQKFSRPIPKKTKPMVGDESFMTQVYGKASYQKGRTTVKDPYLHYQNTAKRKAPRPAGVVEVQGTEKMSSKTQTSAGAVKQFYFNPSTGTYIPIAATAPMPGQLIPMAVPLGGPRIDGGLKVSSTTVPPGHVTFQMGGAPQVTADRNVAMVSVPADLGAERGHLPELGKQVLPAMDIDTDLSEISEEVSEVMEHEQRDRRRVHLASPRRSPSRSPVRSPAKGHYEVVYHQDSGEEDMDEETEVMRVVETDQNQNSQLSPPSVSMATVNPQQQNGAGSDDTFAGEDDDDVETATGLEFPGYQPAETPEVEYNGPAFPPKQPTSERQMTSDLIAEDIRRRDLLQNKANEWIEQELMARIISEVYPLRDVEEPADLSHVVSETSEDSMAEEKERSMFVMDSIGHRGMQLFIDAGRPVDNSLVNELVKEVLQDKIRTMLGQRPDQADRPIEAKEQGEDPQWEEPISEEIEPPVKAHQVITPEPTPRASPSSSPPPRHAHIARTPPASPTATPRPVEREEPEMYIPPPQPVQPVIEPESEPESSASYDIQDELQRLTDKLHGEVQPSMSVQSRHSVTTPPESPKPQPPSPPVYRPLTPPVPSPRHVPVADDMMISQTVVPPAQARSPKHESPAVSLAESAKVLEEVEEAMEDQPKPVVFTVAETQTDVVEEKKPRSPSPQRRKSESRTPSESSYTESSSISDTFNECVSEGQWLINKSDGEVADFPIDEGTVRDRMLRASHKRVDVSSASTWKDIDDMDLEDVTDVSRSEGEFLYKTEFPPEKDPVLDLLARLQNSQPQYGMYDMSNRQVTDVLNVTGKSEGEVIRVAARQEQQLPQHNVIQVSQSRSKSPQPNMIQVSQSRSKSPHRGVSPQKVGFDQSSASQRGGYDQRGGAHGGYDQRGGAYPKGGANQRGVSRQRSLSPERSGSPSHRGGSPHRSSSPSQKRAVSSSQRRSQSPVHRTQSPTRVSFEGDLNDERPMEQRSISPTRGILKQSSGPGQVRRSREEDYDLPVRDSGPRSHGSGRLTAGGRQPQPRGMITAGGRSPSPGKSSMRRPPQVIKSSTMPDSRSSGPRQGVMRTSSEDYNYRSSLENTGGLGYYSSEHGTRTMTPDQMNLDSLIQSGYLSQSFSQSEPGGLPSAQSSMKSSGDLRLSRTSTSGRSLGYSYGTESFSESELQRLATQGTGKLQMSVTIPGIDGFESDLSEIDITDGGSTR